MSYLRRAVEGFEDWRWRRRAAGNGLFAGVAGLTGVGGPVRKLSHEERFNRAMADLDALENAQEPAGLKWLFLWLKDKFDWSVVWCVDVYTGFAFWLHSKYPRGYLLLFFAFGTVSSAIYVYDIYTDVLVAVTLYRNGLLEEFGIVTLFFLLHFFVISFMLGVKMYYHFEMRVLQHIDRVPFPWDPSSSHSIHDAVQQQEVDAFLKSLTSSTVQLSSETRRKQSAVESTGGTLLISFSKLVRLLLKLVAFALYCVTLLLASPFLDIAMMCLELLGGSLMSRARSKVTRRILAFQNFLLQYETIRVPARSYLESIPQTAYQGYLYSRLKDNETLDLNLDSLIQSIAISIVSGAKNTIEIWIAYKVSGFSFWSYVHNAVLFEGAATLPFRWNAKRSSMLDRLVLGGDFYTLAHAQKMKLFQAALEHRKTITITTDEARALDEECVVVASSLTMLEFIANMLPVSLSEHRASSATIRIDITDIKNLPWRDDERTVSRERALKILISMHESLMAFINVGMIWQKLEVVRMVNCDLPDNTEEEVDYGGLGELLLRSRVKVLEMTHTHIGDKGLKGLLFGLVENTSLVRLGLAGTGITALGARQLLQGLGGHDALAELDVSLNHLKSEGAQHLARLIVTLPALQQLHVSAIGMKADGLQALSMQASYVPKLRVLNMSANPDAFETPEAMDLLVTLLMRAPHGLNLNVGHCKLDSARVEGLCRGGMIGKRGLRGLGLSGNLVTKQGVAAFCDAVWARVQRDRYALGFPELPAYVPYQSRGQHAIEEEAMQFHDGAGLTRTKQVGDGNKGELRRSSLSFVGSQIIPSAPTMHHHGYHHHDSKRLLQRPSSMMGLSSRLSRFFSIHKEVHEQQDTIEDKPLSPMPTDKPLSPMPTVEPSQPSDSKPLTPLTPWSTDEQRLSDNKEEDTGISSSFHGHRRPPAGKGVTFSKIAQRVTFLSSSISKLSSMSRQSKTSSHGSGWSQLARRDNSDASDRPLLVAPSGQTTLRLHPDESYKENERDSSQMPQNPKLNRKYIVLLELCHCNLRRDDVYELCHVFTEAPGLMSLDLSHNSELGNSSLCAIAHLILGPQRDTMTRLRMVNCGLSGAGMRMQGVPYALSRLTDLDLGYNPLGTNGAFEICMEVLNGTPFRNLQVLGLAAINIGKEGFNFILDALASNSCLQRLDLSNNFIGSFETHSYETFQNKNKALKLLDLRENELSNEWCAVLVRTNEGGMGRVIQL